MSCCFIAVLMCIITRMARCKRPGTGISRAFKSGTNFMFKPLRAASAGKAAFKSGVTVKMMLHKLSSSVANGACGCSQTEFWASISINSSLVASKIASGVFWFTVVAPRMPRIIMMLECNIPFREDASDLFRSKTRVCILDFV